MLSTQKESPALYPAVAEEMLIYWPRLPQDEKAFVASYVSNAYSATLAAEETGLHLALCKKLLAKPEIKHAIREVQDQLGSFDFLNEKWVKAQMMRIYPMVMGDEPVPLVTAQGEEIQACKFQPDIAVKILEYVAPKKTQPTVSVTINNAAKLSDQQLEEIAMRGNTYDN